MTVRYLCICVVIRSMEPLILNMFCIILLLLCLTMLRPGFQFSPPCLFCIYHCQLAELNAISGFGDVPKCLLCKSFVRIRPILALVPLYFSVCLFFQNCTHLVRPFVTVFLSHFSVSSETFPQICSDSVF